MADIWKDPRVIDALKERSADDIAVLSCPDCGKLGYYNEGSHFTCLTCEKDFYVLGEGESKPTGVPCVEVQETVRLSDCVELGEGP